MDGMEAVRQPSLFQVEYCYIKLASTVWQRSYQMICVHTIEVEGQMKGSVWRGSCCMTEGDPPLAASHVRW